MWGSTASLIDRSDGSGVSFMRDASDGLCTVGSDIRFETTGSFGWGWRDTRIRRVAGVVMVSVSSVYKNAFVIHEFFFENGKPPTLLPQHPLALLAALSSLGIEAFLRTQPGRRARNHCCRNHYGAHPERWLAKFSHASVVASNRTCVGPLTIGCYRSEKLGPLSIHPLERFRAMWADTESAVDTGFGLIATVGDCNHAADAFFESAVISHSLAGDLPGSRSVSISPMPRIPFSSRRIVAGSTVQVVPG